MKCRWLKENKAAVIAVAVTLLFAVANSMLLLKDFYYLSLLPLAGLVLLLFVVKFETGLLCMAFLTPLPSILLWCRRWSCRCRLSL